MTFEILPAIDLRNDKAVRLYQGDYDQETIYSDDPVTIATGFAADGARWLHVVDLDGAREGKARHSETVRRIVAESGMQVELGGGIRNDKDIERVLEWGVSRVIVGTAAAEDPEWFARAVARYPGKLVAGIDIKDGQVATRGWVESSGLALEDFIGRMNGIAPAAIVFTEISRDGAMQGPDLDALKRVLNQSDVPVIASGGISSLDDIRAVAQLADQGPLLGVITGRAIYENAFTVKEAVDAVR